jgi:hypothetical protein
MFSTGMLETTARATIRVTAPKQFVKRRSSMAMSLLERDGGNDIPSAREPERGCGGNWGRSIKSVRKDVTFD